MSRFRPSFLAAITALVLAAATAAIAQEEPPDRVARLNHVEGQVSFSPAKGSDWTNAELNRPLVRGDRFWADKGTRAEIQIGSAVLRMDGDARIEVLAMGDDTAQLSVTQGSVQLHVRSLPEGENFEIDTPNLAYRMAYPGAIRIDVDGPGQSTRVTLRSGAGAVYGEHGQVLPMGGGQQVTFRGRSLEQVAAHESPPQDSFDRWSGERDRRDEQSVAARLLPRELVGYQWLDANGQWGRDPAHGDVWFPDVRGAEWAPYQNGHWEWLAPWGWTWIDEKPWAFAPSHYGRWAIVGARWAWVPGRMPLRPTYAPALVAFLGGSGPAAPAIAGKPGVAWLPLAPGEPWQPGARAWPMYLARVNANTRPVPATGHAHRQKTEAISVMTADEFASGKSARAGRLPVAGAWVGQAQVVPAPPKPERVAGNINAGRTAGQRQSQQQEPASVQAAGRAKAQQLPANQAKKEQTKAEKGKANKATPPREQQAKRTPAPKSTASAKKPEQDRTHAQQVEASRRAADREAQALRAQREEAARRRQEQERGRADFWQRLRQALGG